MHEHAGHCAPVLQAPYLAARTSSQSTHCCLILMPCQVISHYRGPVLLPTWHRLWQHLYQLISASCTDLLRSTGSSCMHCQTGRLQAETRLPLGLTHMDGRDIWNVGLKCGNNSRVIILTSLTHFRTYRPKQGGPIRFDHLNSPEGYRKWPAYVSTTGTLWHSQTQRLIVSAGCWLPAGDYHHDGRYNGSVHSILHH